MATRDAVQRSGGVTHAVPGCVDVVVVGGTVVVVVVVEVVARDVVVDEPDRAGEPAHAASAGPNSERTSAAVSGRTPCPRDRVGAVARCPLRLPAPRTPFIAARGRGPVVAPCPGGTLER